MLVLLNLRRLLDTFTLSFKKGSRMYTLVSDRYKIKIGNSGIHPLRRTGTLAVLILDYLLIIKFDG